MKRTTDYDTIIVEKKRYSKHHMPFSTCKHLSDDVYIEMSREGNGGEFLFRHSWIKSLHTVTSANKC